MTEPYAHPVAAEAIARAAQCVGAGDYVGALSAVQTSRLALAGRGHTAPPPDVPAAFSLQALLGGDADDPFTVRARDFYGILELAAAELELHALALGHGIEAYTLFAKTVEEIDSFGMPYSELLMESDPVLRMLRHSYILPDNKSDALPYAYRLLTLGDRWVTQYECDEIRAAEDWNDFRRLQVYYYDGRAAERMPAAPLAGNFTNHFAMGASVFDCVLTAVEKWRMNKHNEFLWINCLFLDVIYTKSLVDVLVPQKTGSPTEIALYECIFAPVSRHILRQLEYEDPPGYGRTQAADNFISELKKLPGIDGVSSFVRVKEAVARYKSPNKPAGEKKSGFDIRGLFGKKKQ